MPMKDCNSARFFGGGMLRIALILFSSGLIPSGVHLRPQKDALFALNWHCLG